MSKTKKIIDLYKLNQNKKLKKINKKIKIFIEKYLPKYISKKIKNNFNVNECILPLNNEVSFFDYLNNEYALSYIVSKIYNKYGIIISINKEKNNIKIDLETCYSINKKINAFIKKYNINETFIIKKIKYFIDNKIKDYIKIKLLDNVYSNYIEISYNDLDINEILFKDNISFIMFYIEYKYKLKTHYSIDSKIQIKLEKTKKII